MKLEKEYLDSIYRLADMYNESADDLTHGSKKTNSKNIDGKYKKLKKDKANLDNISSNSPIRLTSSIASAKFDDKMLENQ